MSVTKVLMTLVKLAFACVVLAVGWMMLSPGSTSSWPLWSTIQAAVTALGTAFPLERPAFAVVVLVLGAASLLAALPVPVKARGRKSLTSVSDAPGPVDAEPVAHPVAETVTHTEPAEPAEAIMVAEPVAETTPEQVPEPAPESVAEPVSAMDLTPVAESTPLSLDDEELAARHTLTMSSATSDRSRLADLLKKRGDVAETEGRLDEAMGAYEESIALRREVLVAAPEDAREQRWLWTTLESLAECREDRGHRTRAAALFRESVSAGIRAVALAPQKTHYPQELNETRARLTALEAQLAV